MESSTLYEFTAVQELYPQGSSHVYYHELESENITDNLYIDNEIYADSPITEIVWYYAQDACFKISGVIETALAANLTIAASCLDLVDVEFKNIWMIDVVSDVSIDNATINYAADSSANITIDGVGSEENPIYSLSVMGNINLEGSNWIIDLKHSGEQFTQEGSALIPGKLHIDSSFISFSNASLLEVGEYYLKGQEISYEGMIDAKRGDLVIEYLGGSDLIIKQNLRAAGVVRLISDFPIINYAQIVAKQFEVICPLFTNYGRIKINERSVFDLVDGFHNAVTGSQRGYFKTEELYLGSQKATDNKINLIKNEGIIEIGYGEIHSKEMQLLALGFKKSGFELVSTPRNDNGGSKGKTKFFCYLYEEKINNLPNAAILKIKTDVHLDVNNLKMTSSKISSGGKVFFYDTSIIKEDFKLYQHGKCHYESVFEDVFNNCKRDTASILSGYGKLQYSGMYYDSSNAGRDYYGRVRAKEDVTSQSNPAIKQIYQSQIQPKGGVEGNVVGEISNLEISWQEQVEATIGDGKDLVLYNDEVSKSLSAMVATQRKIYARYLRSFLKMTSKSELDIMPLGQVNSNLFVLNNAIDLTPGTIQFLISKRSDLLEYEYENNAIAISDKNYFDEYVSILSSWATSNQLPVLLLGDEKYLKQLFEDRIFLDIGYIVGLDNGNLAQEFIANTIDFKYGEMSLAERREDPFIIGKPLTELQISKLQKPIAWFVEQENCLETGYGCLVPRIYFTEENLKNFIWQAGLISEGTIRLNVVGNVFLSMASIIHGKKVELNVDGHIVSFGGVEGGKVQISSSGGVVLAKVEAEEKFFLNALNAILTDQIKSGGEVTLEIVQDLAIATLVTVNNYGSQITSHIESESSIEAKGKVTVTASKIGIKGAKIIGDSVYVKGEDKVFILSTELYFETIRYGKKFYQKYREMRSIEPLVIATGTVIEGINHIDELQLEENSYSTSVSTGASLPGSITIDSGDSITIKGGKYKAQTSIDLISHDGGLGVEPADNWQSFEEVKKKKKWFSSKITTTRKYNENPSLVEFDAPNLNIHTKSHQTLIGVDIRAKIAKLTAGTPEHAASISILPTTKISSVEVQTKTTGFVFKFENNGVTFLEKKSQGKGEAHIEPVPSVLQMENEFYVYASSNYVHVQPMFLPDENEEGKMRAVINAQNIQLESAPSIHTEYTYLNKMGYGVGFSSKKGEYAIKAALSIEQKRYSHTKVVHEIPRIFSGFLTLNATDRIYDQGILIHAQQLQINSKIEMHDVSVDIETNSEVKKLFETGLKLGIKSSFSSLKDTGEEIISQDYKTPEGVITAAFKSWKLYTGVLKFLSGGGIKAGGWFYLEGSKSKEYENIKGANPTRIIAEDLNITTEQFILRGTEIHAINATIKAIEMDAIAAENIYDYNKIVQGADGEVSLIPLGSTSILPSLNIAFGKDKIKQQQRLNVKIYVSNRLTLDVETLATMKGTNIEARELFATFGDLVFESLQDILEIEGKGVNLGVGLKVLPDSIGARLRNGKRHVVENLSSMIGTKEANIIIANSLMLNGAIFANAERDENGRYTDHGNLVVKMSELFVKHIHDYDNGYTLQAAVNYASATSFLDKTGKTLPFESLEATLALNRGEGWSLATIGEGTVECTKEDGICQIDKLNRDLNKAQTFEKEIDIKPLFLYYTNLRPSDFKLPKDPREFLERTFDNIAQDLGFKATFEKEVANLAEELQKEYEKLSEEDKAKADEYSKEQEKVFYQAVDDIADIEKEFKEGKITKEDASLKFFQSLATQIRNLGTGYLDFANKHPVIAKYGLSALNIGIQTLIAGVPGLINASRSEAIGFAIGELVGDQAAKFIKDKIDTTSIFVQNNIEGLDETDAKSLAAGLIIGSVIVTFGAAGVKSLFKDLKHLSKIAKSKIPVTPDGIPVDTNIADDLGNSAIKTTDKGKNIFLNEVKDSTKLSSGGTTKSIKTKIKNEIAKDTIQQWHQSTFGNIENSIQYHFNKHGKGRSLAEYTTVAKKFFELNKNMGKEVTLRDGTKGIKIKIKTFDSNGKIRNIGGYWTKEGKIVSFFD
ncbi:MAG: hypothetical protein AAF673_00745 [Pseudomonadota bacterium]